MYTKLRIGNKCNKRPPITVKHAIKKNAVTYSIIFYLYVSVVEIPLMKYILESNFGSFRTIPRFLICIYFIASYVCEFI